MKKKFEKVMGVCLAAMLLLSACSGEKPDENNSSSQATVEDSSVVEESSMAEESSEESVESEASSEAPAESEVSSEAPVESEVSSKAPVESEASSETSKASASSSKKLDWENLAFTLDGQECAIFDDFKVLQDLGWDFDLADYGKQDGYVMNPGDSVFSTINLENEKYMNEDNKYKCVTVTVGFKNVSDEIKDIKECAISAFKIDAYRSGLLELRPEFDFLGLTFGSSKEDMEKVLGTAASDYRSEDLGYTAYTYENDYSEKIRITVYDDIGITGFELQSYR